MRSHLREKCLWLSTLLFAVVVSVAPGRARAAGEHESDEAAESHGEGHSEHEIVIGAKGSYLAAFVHDEVHSLWGGGLFTEFPVANGCLEIEIFGRLMGDDTERLLPIDVLLKKPFHPNDVFHPFIGIGVAAVISLAEGAEVFGGGVLSLGANLWVTHRFGFVIEGNYNLIYEHEAVNELGVNAGFMVAL